MSSSATQSRSQTPSARRKTPWSKDDIAEALRSYAAQFGTPTSASFNPATARWHGSPPEVIARYRAGQADGTPWPSLNTIKKVHGGWAAAILAAGLTPARTGPKRRSEVNRDEVAARMDGDTRIVLEAAEARASVAERQLAARGRELERARAVSARLREESVRVRIRVRTERVKVVDERAVRRAEARAASAVRDAAGAGALVAAANAEARKAAAALSRREKIIEELRLERRELRVRVRKLERLLESMGPGETVEVERIVERVVTRELPGPGTAELAAMDRERTDALGEARRARKAEADARADYLELAAAVKGEARVLSRAEIAELRTKGPSGPVMVSNALKALAAARRTNNPAALTAALGELASAAVGWRERL